jgi:hypothetical protein
VHTYHRLSHVFHSLNFSSPQEDEDEGEEEEEEERKDLTKGEDEKRYGIIILHQNCLKLFYFIF